MIVVAKSIDSKKAEDLIKAGAEIVELPAENYMIDLGELLAVLGKRQITSVLVEGGSQLFGLLFDRGLVDKVLVFVSPIIIGGESAKTAVGGLGVNKVVDALHLHNVKMKNFEDDVLVSGYVGGK